MHGRTPPPNARNASSGTPGGKGEGSIGFLMRLLPPSLSPSRKRSGRNSSASSPQWLVRLCIARPYMATSVPAGMRSPPRVVSSVIVRGGTPMSGGHKRNCSVITALKYGMRFMSSHLLAPSNSPWSLAWTAGCRARRKQSDARLSDVVAMPATMKPKTLWTTSSSLRLPLSSSRAFSKAERSVCWALPFVSAPPLARSRAINLEPT
mmetsp:Transcript_67124/g.143628  ORF Transcript_67124/g.143628 Transcript_67124/m.143628 type:complete len:207 (-) Transcript_67124:1214-1834(-)